MKNYLRQNITPLVVSLVLCCALCGPFVPFAFNDCYFRLFPFSVAVLVICVTAFLLNVKRKTFPFHFCLADGLLCLIVVYYLIRYDYSLHLADWKIIYAVLLLVLWFAARICFLLKQPWLHTFIVCLTCIGLLLVGWGGLQLYGILEPGHILFKITGPFFNPGPYSGYLAMLLPICLHGFFQSTGWIRHLCLFSVLSMFCILPAAMSRSAWIAIFISTFWILSMNKGWWIIFKRCLRQKTAKTISALIAGSLVITAAGIAMYQLKTESAQGRLLIWKNTCNAICERPVVGYGVGTFPSVYGKEQAAYFASGKATPVEEHVAGIVEYAFNDYLQLALEGGIPLLILVLIFGITIFHRGMTCKGYGFCGAILAFAVFALSSYPMQVLPFGIALIIFGAACITSSRRYPDESHSIFPLCLSISICIVACCMVWQLRNTPYLHKEWKRTDILYYNNFYHEAINRYQSLYSDLNGHPAFLWNYALALGEENNYSEACRILERQKLVSCNANIWNKQGFYYLMSGHYCEAEQCFYYSLQLIPKRIYPYYLLAKLYSTKGYYNREKALEMAHIVLTKEPKVHSNVIDEMRTEMKSLYNQLIN